MIGEL